MDRLPTFITPRDAAEMLGHPESAVVALADAGDLLGFRVEGTLRLAYASVLEWLGRELPESVRPHKPDNQPKARKPRCRRPKWPAWPRRWTIEARGVKFKDAFDGRYRVYAVNSVHGLRIPESRFLYLACRLHGFHKRRWSMISMHGTADAAYYACEREAR